MPRVAIQPRPKISSVPSSRTHAPTITTQPQRPIASGAVPLNAARILAFQKTHGNQHVRRMLANNTSLVQRTLADDVSEVLQDTKENKFERLNKRLESKDYKTSDRQEAYKANETLIRDSKGLNNQEKTVILGLLLKGSLQWLNTNSFKDIQNHFAKFFLHDKDEADPEADLNKGSMNCWETVMFLAYKAGAVSRKQIKELHMTIPHNTTQAVWNFLGFHRSKGEYTEKDIEGFAPDPGQIVFFKDEDGNVAHVALAVSGDQVLSLWNEPDGIETVQKVAVKSLLSSDLTVSVANPPWSGGGDVGKAVDNANLHAESDWKGYLQKQLKFARRAVLPQDEAMDTVIPKHVDIEDLDKKLMEILEKNPVAAYQGAHEVAKIFHKEHPGYMLSELEKATQKAKKELVPLIQSYAKEDFTKEDIASNFDNVWNIKEGNAKEVIDTMVDWFEDADLDGRKPEDIKQVIQEQYEKLSK